MNTEGITAITLKLSVVVGISITVIGLILQLLNFGTDVLWAGLLVLIVSPLISVIVTTVSLIIGKEKKWILVAATLICISALEIVFSILK